MMEKGQVWTLFITLTGGIRRTGRRTVLLSNLQPLPKLMRTLVCGRGRGVMTGPPTTFEVLESRAGDRCWLRLSGELDLASAPIVEDRLTRLRGLKLPVSLDLSRVEFIDSTGIHLLVRTVGEARLKHWDLRIENDIPPQLMSVLRLLHLDRFLLSARADVPPTGRGRLHPASY